MEEIFKKEETVYTLINSLGHNRCLFVNSEFKDHIALSDYVGEAMGGAFKQWYTKADLIGDLRATADLIEKVDF